MVSFRGIFWGWLFGLRGGNLREDRAFTGGQDRGEDGDLRRLLVRELQRGKLAGFIGIGGGLKAFRAEQSLTGKGFTQSWMQLTYCLIWILITPLRFLLMFEWLLVCLGWIMKATYCLLRYNPELMLDVVNLNMPCFYCEISRESCP